MAIRCAVSDGIDQLHAVGFPECAVVRRAVLLNLGQRLLADWGRCVTSLCALRRLAAIAVGAAVHSLAGWGRGLLLAMLRGRWLRPLLLLRKLPPLRLPLPVCPWLARLPSSSSSPATPTIAAKL